MEKKKIKRSKRHLGRRLLVSTLIGLIATPVIATLVLLTVIQLPIGMALPYGAILGTVFGGLVGVSAGGISYILGKQKLEAEEEEEELTTNEGKSDEEENTLTKDKKKEKQEKREKKKAERQEKKEAKKQQKLIKKQEKASASLTKSNKKKTESIKENSQEERKQTTEESIQEYKTNSKDKPKNKSNDSQTLPREQNQPTIYRLDKNMDPKKNKVLFSDPYNQTAKMQRTLEHNLSINEEKIVTDVMARLEKLNRQLQEIQGEIEMLKQQLAVLDSVQEEKQLRRVK